MKGISKSFVKYKESLKNPTEDELAFHDFVHNAVKKREENRLKAMKKKRETQIIEEKIRRKKEDVDKLKQPVPVPMKFKSTPVKSKPKKKKKKSAKLIGQVFIDPGKVKRVEVNNENIQYYNKIYEEGRSEEAKIAIAA